MGEWENVAYIADIVIAVFFALSIFLGYKRGFIKTVFSCFSLVVALILAYMFGSNGADIIRKTPLEGAITRSVSDKVYDYFDSSAKESEEKIKDGLQNLENSSFASSLERLGVDTGSLAEKCESAIQSGKENMCEKIVSEITDVVADCLVGALGTLCVFVLALILLKILSVLLQGLFRLPVLKSINTVGGVIAGLVFAIFGAFVLCTVLSVLLPYIPENPVLYPGLENDTVLYRFFASLNPVIFLLFA